MTRAEACVEQLHQHVHQCNRAGYTNGRADLAEAIEAALAEPDDTQQWEAVEGDVTTVDVVRVDRIRALLQEPPC